MTRHFLKLGDRSIGRYRDLFLRTHELKRRRREGLFDTTLRGKTLVLLFEKASTRTRLSFEAAAFQLGGHCIDLPISQSQVNRGEPLTDTAKVIAGYADAVVFRTHGDDRLAQFAGASKIPVINGLSDGGHPVQLLADLFTIEEKLGSVAGKTVAFVGDGATNMGLSFIEAAKIFDFELRLAAPVGYQPKLLNEHVVVTVDPQVAVDGADVVVTDVWTSMGQEAETAARLEAFHGFQVDARLMSIAKKSAIVLHCLPAHRGEEISAEVIDGPQSVVFDEAENRMHVQKALLEDCIADPAMLTEYAWDNEYEVRKKSELEDLRAEAGKWAATQDEMASVSSTGAFVVSQRGDYENLTILAVLQIKRWYSAQSGSDWGDYYYRLVEATFRFCKLGEIRVLGESTDHVTENGDGDYDTARERRAFVDATLVKHGLR